MNIGTILNEWAGVISAVIALLLFFGLDGKMLYLWLRARHRSAPDGQDLSLRRGLMISLIVGSLVWSSITTYRLQSEARNQLELVSKMVPA